MMNNMKELMKQAQKMQREMMSKQEALADKEYEASAGGDMVKVKINGKFEIKEVKISKEIVDPEDIEMLEDLVISGVNSAIQKAQTDANDDMKGLTKGMNIPGLNL